MGHIGLQFSIVIFFFFDYQHLLPLRLELFANTDVEFHLINVLILSKYY
jgi:hypothetical protein